MRFMRSRILLLIVNTNMRDMIDLIREYQEEAGSSFTNNNVEYDLNAIFDIEDELPLYHLDVIDLVWILEWDDPDPKRVARADDDIPIIVSIWRHKLVVLDGLHRLAKAAEDELETLPVRFLPPCRLRYFKYDHVGERNDKCIEGAELYRKKGKWYYDENADQT